MSLSRTFVPLDRWTEYFYLPAIAVEHRPGEEEWHPVDDRYDLAEFMARRVLMERAVERGFEIEVGSATIKVNRLPEGANRGSYLIRPHDWPHGHVMVAVEATVRRNDLMDDEKLTCAACLTPGSCGLAGRCTRGTAHQPEPEPVNCRCAVARDIDMSKGGYICAKCPPPWRRAGIFRR